MLLLSREGQLVKVYRIRRLVDVAIHLIVDCDAVPASRGRRIVPVQRRSLAIERNGMEQEVTVRGALHVQGQMIPRVAHRVAGHTAGDPMPTGVAPSIPFMPAINAALMAPNVRLSVDELVDIKL